jgi:ribosomal-protein-alanine N-acetyltransferase
MPMQNPWRDRLRAITPQDAEDMAAIRATCFDHAWGVETFAEMLSQPHTWGFILPASGYILLQSIPPEAEIITIAVAPAARRQGLGEALLQMAQESLPLHGMHTLHLEVSEKLVPARALYEKSGFVRSGLRKGYYRSASGESADAILMRWQIPL